MSIFSRKERLSADQLARLFIDEVTHPNFRDSSSRWRRDYERSPGYDDRFMRNLYIDCHVVVFMALALAIEKKGIPEVVDSYKKLAVEEIQDRFEELTVEEIDAKVNSSFSLFQELLNVHDGKEMSWSMKWLAISGIEETNPVSLALVAFTWREYFAAALESAKGAFKTAKIV